MSSLAAESWTWYGLTWLVVIIRMASQILLRGSLKKLKTDDALMMFAMITDTVLIICINIVSNTNSNLFDPNQPPSLTPADIDHRTFGSKMVVVTEQMQILTIWTVKACLLLIYHRLTLSLKGNLAVKFVAGYVLLGFILMEVLYLGVWCRPFDQYWAVPSTNPQCSAATNHLITNAVFNITSDVMMLLIPMPVFLRSQLAPRRKIVLCIVFALGAFTILSAILNKYYSFSEPYGSQWTFWYIRESSTAIIVANLPLTWTFCRRVFNLRSFDSKGFSASRSGQPMSSMRSQTHSHGRKDPTGSAVIRDRMRLETSDSLERIHKPFGTPLKIYQRHDVQVRSEYADYHAQDRCTPCKPLPGLLTTTIEGGPRLSLTDAESNSETSLEPTPLARSDV